MRSVKRVLLFAGLCLLLAACSLPLTAPVVPESGEAGEPAGQTGAPVLPQGSAGAPPRLIDRLLYRGTSVLDRVVDGVTAVHLDPWQTEAAVGSGPVEITWQLDTHDARPYRGLLRTEGAEPAQVRTVLGVIQARFEPPLPDQWTVWLDGVAGSHTRLVRYPEPGVTVSYLGPDGDLIPLEANEAVLPAGPLELQLAFDRPVDEGSLVNWALALEACAGQPVRVEQASGGRWWIRMEEAPDSLHLDLRMVVAAESGLPVSRYPLTLWSEEALPYLERVDPATGEAEPVLRLPPAVSEAQPSPDGAWIALRSWRSDGDRWLQDRVSIADLNGNRMSPVPLEGGTLLWAGGRLVNRSPEWAAEQVWEVWDPAGGDPAIAGPVRLPDGLAGTLPVTAAFSPDGRTAAYLALDDPSDLDGAGPPPLVLVDLQTGEPRALGGELQGGLPAADADSPGVAWSPDGSRIAALEPLSSAGGSQLAVYDLEREERQVVGGPLPVEAWGARLSWSPRGDRLLILGGNGEAWLVPLDGGPAVAVAAAGYGQVFWDAAGERILWARAPWGGVFVLSLADGTLVDLGDGLPAGWAGDSVYVIRRPDPQPRCGPPLP